MIQQNLKTILEEIGETQLIAVSKYRSKEELMELYHAGQRVFAENRVQELLRKEVELPQDIEWHLIGHLQTNKVKQIIGKVALIHSGDRTKLLKEIQKEAAKAGLTLNVLLQVHVADEESKYGFQPDNLKTEISNELLNRYPNIRFKGIMSMATYTDDQEQVRSEFRKTKQLFDYIKENHPNPSEFTAISMGMSGDYQIAIEEGATMVRIGSKLFE